MTPASGAATVIDGRYRLGDVLGTGGAAVVRRAHDERLHRDVAVKLFHPTGSDVQRQSGELALMASLAHPALVRMYDGGTTTDANGAASVYLVMELVSGPTLHRALDDGPMRSDRVAAIGRDLAGALAYLSARGVVHRDVKPANVLLTPGDDDVAAKLGDLGVARMLDGTRVTATGMTVGTANYLSPEQVRGEAVGPPSDVYSLGLVLLEALTGRIAYDGVGVAAALARLNRAPEIPAALGPQWCPLLAAMLSDDPAARPLPAQVRGALTAHPLAAPVAPTAVLPAAVLPAVLPAGGSRRRSLRPVTAFLVAAAVGAAVVVGVIASAMSGGSSAPAAPVPSVSSTPTPVRSSPATAHTSTSTRATQVANSGQTSRPGPTATPAPAPVPAGPAAGPGKDKGKAKGHGKHDDN